MLLPQLLNAIGFGPIHLLGRTTRLINGCMINTYLREGMWEWVPT